jgi:hypothetical protein
MSNHAGTDVPDKPTQDLFLLFSLLLLILMHPVLAQGRWPRLLLGILTFVPLIVATIRLAHRRDLIWPLVLLIASAMACGVGAFTSGSSTLFIIQWAILTITFGLTVVGLFSYLQRATAITAGHLFTAASIYLLLTLGFFALYTAIAALHPDSFATAAGPTRHSGELLYFSLATLTTVGYGDIVAVGEEVRLIAGLEAATGVLYVAITVAVLVSGYKAREH